MPCRTILALVGEGVLLDVLDSVVLHKDVVISEETIPSEVEGVAGDGDILDLVGELDEFLNLGFVGDLINGAIKEFEGLLGDGVVLRSLRSPHPVDGVAQPGLPVEAVGLANKLPAGDTDTSEELPHQGDLRGTASVLEAHVVELDRSKCQVNNCYRLGWAPNRTLFIW